MLILSAKKEEKEGGKGKGKEKKGKEKGKERKGKEKRGNVALCYIHLELFAHHAGITSTFL